jgi:CDP-paratose synthetase
MVIIKRSFSDTSRINPLLHQVTSYDIDITRLENVFKEQNIDVVIHTATNYGRKNSRISKIVDDNILFGLRIFETALENNTDIFFNTDTLQDKFLSDYTLSKKQFVEWLRFFNKRKKIKIVNLRLEHLYGSGDDNTKFVVWLMEQMLSGRNEINLTHGDQKRDFINIDDVVNVFLLLLRRTEILPGFCEFDVGTGEQISIREFVLKLKDTIELIYNKPISINLNFGAIPYRKGEMMEVAEDITPLLNLGWKPNILLSEGLKRLVKEFREREENQ